MNSLKVTSPDSLGILNMTMLHGKQQFLLHTDKSNVKKIKTLLIPVKVEHGEEERR